MKKYGLIGEKLGHSHSPMLHRLLGAYDYRLIPLKPEELDGFLRSGTFDGINVTIPYKKSVIPYCAELGQAARRIGSVNTIVRREDGSLFGDNTDAFGFMEMARQAGICFAGQKTLVLGSGGTSLTACAVVEDAGGMPVVVSRSGGNHYQNLDRHADATLLVNTTPVGMYPHTAEAPVDLSGFPRLRGVLDVIYNPLRTRLLQQAEEQGIPCAGGLAMLVGQAAQASRLFTGRSIPEEQVKQVFEALRKKLTNLVLVGMPGCGKTTIGNLLAKQLNMPLVDIDEEIEKESGQSIPSLFTTEGEAGFRAREAALVRRYGMQAGQIIVTGGGAVLRADNREAFRLNGFVVHLLRDIQKLPLGGRPLSASVETLELLWEQRAPLYAACADATVSNDGAPGACAAEVRRAFDEAICH